MKYRMLFLIKLSYYLEGKKIILNPELYSLFVNFIFECSFLKEQIKVIKKMMILKENNLEFCYDSFLKSYNYIKEKICDENMNYLVVKDGFYQLFTEKELKIMNDLVWYFYNYYSLYLDKLSNGKEKLPYDYRNNTKIYVLS